MVTETAENRKERIDPALIKLGVVVLLGIIVSVIDGTLMVVAIDAIRRDFNASTQTIQWVTGAYLLATCAVIPASGYAVNRFSARKVWLVSLSAFLVASVLCSLAWSPASLICFRVLQGFSGGLIGMVATIVLTRAAGPERAGRAFSAVAVPSNLAPVVGPIAGGLLVDAASWRWLFFGQIPLLIFALCAAWYVLPKDQRDPRARLDWVGLMLVTSGMSALVYGLSVVTRIGDEGLMDSAGGRVGVAAVVAGLLLMLGFVIHAVRSRTTPLIDVRLFAHLRFTIANVLLFVAGFLLYGLLFLIPLYYQQVVGLDAASAGVLLAPQGAGMGIAGIFVGSLTDRFGPRPVVLCGLVLVMAGTFPFVGAGTDPNGLLMGMSLAVRGAGLASVSIPLAATLYKLRLPDSAIPHITTISAVAMRVGGAFGAAMAAVGLQLASPHAGSGGTTAGSAPASAFAHTFGWMTGLLLVPLLLAMLLPGRRIHRSKKGSS